MAEWKLETTKAVPELLLPHIEMLLQAAQVEKQQLRVVAVSLGPGSFTGLRIGLATAKALAYALGIPLIGVPTLEALAYNCPAPGLLLSPFLDAQKGNVYQGRYRIENGRVIGSAAAAGDSLPDGSGRIDCSWRASHGLGRRSFLAAAA